MNYRAISKLIVPLCMTALLVACGGSSDGGSAALPMLPEPDAPTEPVAPAVTLGYGIKELQFSWPAVDNATYYRLSENSDGVSAYSVVADNLTATAVNHTIALHQRINARYKVDACNDVGCTSSSEIFMANNLAGAIGYFKSSNTAVRGEFGYAISLSADGSALAVGARWENSVATGVNGDEADNNTRGGGAVYLFGFDGTHWVQQAYLKAGNSEADDMFGYAVSLSADGTTLAVGAIGEDSAAIGVNGDESDNSAVKSGAVYLFGFDGTHWAQQAYLKASNTGELDQFGRTLSLSADGTTLAVGARREDSAATGVNGDGADNSAAESGAVYLFGFDGTHWAQQAYLKASNTDAGDEFGTSLSLSADGTTLAVGALHEASNATGINGDEVDNSAIISGAVYLFGFDGTHWAQQAYLKASNSEAYDWFGYSLNLSADGTTLAVGALLEDSNATGVDGDEADNSARNSGAVYLFGFDGSNWTQQAYLKASNTGSGDEFGTSLSLSADGTTLAAGANLEDSAATGVNGDAADNSAWDSGAVYLFGFDGTHWVQQAYLKAGNSEADDMFGYAVSLSADGTTLAVEAGDEDSAATGIDGDQADNSAPSAGAVYLY